MKTRIISAIAAMLLMSVATSAQESSASYALPFTSISHNPISEAMAGAGMLNTNSMAWSAIANPAAITFSEHRGDIQASYQAWSPSGLGYISAGSAFNFGRFGFGAGMTVAQEKPVQLSDSEGQPAGEFRPSEYQVNLGVSYRFIKWMSAGVSLCYAGQQIAPGINITAPAASAFLMADYNGIKGAVGINNLGAKVQDEAGTRFPIPGSVTFAAGYGKSFGPHAISAELKGDIFLSSSVLKLSDPFTLALGAEYTYNKLVSVRAGYHYGAEKSAMPSFASVGAGVCLYGCHVDLSYCLAGADSPMKNTLCAGVGYRF